MLNFRFICKSACAIAVAAGVLGASAQGTARTEILPEAPSTLVALGDAVQTPSATAPAPAPAQSSTSLHPAQESNKAGAQGTGTKHPREQQGRIFGIVPNFATVSGGATAKPAGWKTDLHTANRQALDYSSFGYLFISSGTAYAEDAHDSLNTYNGGNAIFWAYLWRGFLDKTDGTYQGTFLFPALLHEDTRYYAMGEGSIRRRTIHAVGSIVIARNYSGRSIPNVAGLAGRAGAQAVSTVYYPAGSEGFGELTEKFAYSCLRQAGINVLREFSPDLNELLQRRRRRRSAHVQ